MLQLESPGAAAQKWWKRIPAHIKITFFAAVVIGFLTHTFMLTNKLVNHDDVEQLFHTMHYAIESGRWLLWLPAAFSTSWAMPWVNGVLGILYLAVAACFIAALLRIKTPLYCVLLAALMVTFPAIAATFAYMNCADAYFFAVMLNCMAAYFTVRYRFGFCAGALLLACGLGIYQAYFSVAAGLFVAVLILDLLRGEGAKRTLLRGALYAGTLAAAMAAYFVMVRLTAGDNLTSYQGINEMGRIRPSHLPILVRRAYEGVSHYFVDNRYSDHFPAMRYLFLILGAASVGLFGWLVARKKTYRNLGGFLLLCLLAVLFPLACNLVFIMQGVAFYPHLLMIYGLILLPVFCLALLQRTGEEINKGAKPSRGNHIVAGVSWVVALSLALSAFGNWTRSNQAYFKLHLVYEQGYAYSNTLLTRIQHAEGYTGEEEIVFVGVPQVRYAVKPVWDLYGMTGIPDTLMQMHTYVDFLRYYLGNAQQIVRPSQQRLAEMGLAEIVEGMPLYPEEGSILRAEGRIVVRFSTYEQMTPDMLFWLE
ncbi:MAG: glucosyltransferase domain-containing protein [Clostridia bacterium]|nr:glucosyltransferase domain-containing protein [Clostridia bacterium]